MFLVNQEHIDISPVDTLLFSLVAICIVFLVLIFLVLCVSLLSKIKFKEKKKEEPVFQKAVANNNKKLTIEDIKDEDMMVAALVATAEFVEETKEKDARLVSIKQIG